MFIIKLDAIDSTNDYIKSLVNDTMPKDYTVVVTSTQTKGRGQMGTKWQSESGKNLTASVFKRITNVSIEQQFFISMAVSLAICDALKNFQIPNLQIKWPNDILSEEKKVCGILIENVIKNSHWEATIIGFGLNVNQRYFNNLPNASSLFSLTGRLYSSDELLSEILKQLQRYFDLLEAKDFNLIKRLYENQLFRKDKPSTFKLKDGSMLTGIIKGVSPSGQLTVWLEDDVTRHFDFKELQLLY